MVADFSLTPSIGQLGVPSIEVVLASPGVSSGRPSPPTIVRPRYGEEVFYDGVEPIHITGIGGVKDGWVRIIGGSAGDVIVPVASNGTFDAPVPLGTGLHDLKLAQYTFEPSGVCPPPNPCTRSAAIGCPSPSRWRPRPSKPPES